MADELIRLFNDGVPLTDVGKRRRQEAAAMAERQRFAAAARETMLASPFWTTSVYGPQLDRFSGQSENDIMKNPVEMKWGADFISHVIPEMRSSVLDYAAEQEKVIDTLEHLETSVLAGVPGDPESEKARDAVEAAMQANDEWDVMTRLMAAQYENGFRGGENIYDEITQGEARDIVAPVAVIPGPVHWFGFDWRGRPRFKGDERNRDWMRLTKEFPLVPELKVMFGRSGDLHTRYGKGTAWECYPSVYEIDVEWKKLRRLSERAGDLPMVVTTPYAPGTQERAHLDAEVSRQWKNFIIITGETESGRTEFRIEGTEGAYAGANAVGSMVLGIITRKTEAIKAYLQGTVYSTASQQTGSFARDQVADTGRMYKAPSMAACKEAMLNRGFVRPIMLLNFPTLERAKWPRFSVDSSFGEDLRLLMDIMERATKLGVRISSAYFADRFKLTTAADDDPNVLKAPASPIVSNVAPDAGALKEFSEPVMVLRINGEDLPVPLDTPCLTSDGWVRAGQIQGGEVLESLAYPHLVR